MPRKKKPEPTETFHRVGDFLQFILENNKRYSSDTLYGGNLNGRIDFSDGSYAICEYSEGSVSDSGTWWSETLDIKYYEAKS
jgi:hypothetical protein